MGCGEQYASFEPSLVRKYSMKLGCYDLYTWPLLSVFDFYQNLNQFYGVLAECCTAQSCPAMSAGPGYVKPLERTPAYVDHDLL